ncbi:hypothetical protein M2302_004347 [Micromonospora sp. A200]|uniref:hypothetical protein n=1 Tax=Micromonospora sp. A200 TaxID=2940568 RepID=UPI0024747A83|nr:hypothetical protein [Micromonospora sp. A200]MDH6464150.1 hypothetical protein [Micromonospora sp. A200]
MKARSNAGIKQPVGAEYVGLGVVDELRGRRRPDSWPGGQVKHGVAAVQGVAELVGGQVPAHRGAQPILDCRQVLIGDGVITKPATVEANDLYAAGE